MKSESRTSFPRGRRRAGETSGREALLKAAMKAFSRHGYEAVSLRALAQDASVDMALVARIFGSKADLWLAVINQLTERQHEHLERVRLIADQSITEPRKAMQRFISLFAQISYEMPEFPAFLLHEVSSEGPRLDTLTQQLVTPFRTECEPIIEAAAKADVIKVRDIALFYGMLLSAVSLPMISPATFAGRQALDESLRDAIAEQAIAMFMTAESE